jgi:hypothetical protein
MAGRRYKIKAIVEGQGEERAVPALIQRWLRHERHYDFTIDDRAICAHGVNNLVSARPNANRRTANRQRGVEYFVDFAAKQADAILIVLDGDKCCTKRAKARAEALGPELLRRARATASHVPIGVVVADPEFEAWLLMPPCLEAMKTDNRIAADRWPSDLSDLSRKPDCKGVLRSLLVQGYSPAADQHTLSEYLQFTGRFLAASPSYGKVLRELARLTTEARARR